MTINVLNYRFPYPDKLQHFRWPARLTEIKNSQWPLWYAYRIGGNGFDSVTVQFDQEGTKRERLEAARALLEIMQLQQGGAA